MGVKEVSIVGAGTMGRGMAQLFALAGFQVSLTDSDDKVLKAAYPRIQATLETCCQHGLMSEDQAAAVPGRITVTADLCSAVSRGDVVFEVVYEDLQAKRQLLQQVEMHCRMHAVIASGTSSFCNRDMAVALDRPERFLITHFWNPPHIIPLVEVVAGCHTSDETIETTVSVLEAAGKRPVLVKRDVRGFIGNRLQHALRREAISIVAQGIASPEDVDLVARMSFGLRLPIVGPLETIDMGGLDLTLAIQECLLPELDRSVEPLSCLREKVARGELGIKAGRGFFDWPPGRAEARIRRRDEALLEMVKWLSAGQGPDTPSD